MAERMERVEGKITQQGEQLQQFKDYQYACNNTIGEMMRQLALGMVVDMTQFPTMPIFPGQSLAEEPGSSQAEDVGGDGAEMEEEEET